jgi:hypothetical protein
LIREFEVVSIHLAQVRSAGNERRVLVIVYLPNIICLNNFLVARIHTRHSFIFFVGADAAKRYEQYL